MKPQLFFGLGVAALAVAFLSLPVESQVISIAPSTNAGLRFQLVVSPPAQGQWHVERSTNLVQWRDCIGAQGDTFWTGRVSPPAVYEDSGDSNGVSPMVFYRLAQVTSPPTIIGPEGYDFTNYTTGTVTVVSAVIAGAEPLEALWYRNGLLFTNGDAESVSMVFGTSNVLQGQWQVIATNVFGAATSQVASVTFSPAILGAPMINWETSNRFVNAGSNVTFSVEATGANPISFQWLKNGAPIPGANTTNLTVLNASASDSGYYQVSASNSSGSDVTASVFLTVVPPGVFGSLKWQFQTGGQIFSSPAIGADGTIYVGSDDFKVHALDGQTGAEKWAFETGGNVYSSPAIGADGTVYVGSWDSTLYALDGQTGFEKWEFQALDAIFGSPAIGPHGTVYVASLDYNVYALDGGTGIEKWQFQTGFSIEGGPAIATNGTVYLGSGDGKVYALDGQTGAKRWEFQTGRLIDADPAIGADGTVYVASDGQNVYALDGETGAERWQSRTGAFIGASAALGVDGTIYVAGEDHGLHALDSLTGVEKWEFVTGSGVAAPAVGSDGTIYCGSGDGNLYAVDGATGVGKSVFVTSAPIFTAAAIGTDGTIYFGALNNFVYALRSQSGGLAKTPWPKFHQNDQNTGLAPSSPP